MALDDSPSTSRRIGVLGRGTTSIDAAGRLIRDTRCLVRWWVQAEDRLHDPAEAPTVRQRALGGLPVVETRVRVPDGDVVAVAFATADRGGADVVAFTNESPRAVAIVIDGPNIDGLRSAATAPDDLGLGQARVIPLAHSATFSVAVGHSGSVGDPSTLADAATVAAGWRSLCEAAGRITLPPGPIGRRAVDDLASLRCGLLLDGPPHPLDDPVDHLLAADQLVRMGESSVALVPDVVTALEAGARRRRSPGERSVRAAWRVLAAAGEQRAIDDLARMWAKVANRRPLEGGEVAAVTALEWRFVAPRDDRVELFGAGFDDEWLGQSLEAHGLPGGGTATVSVAVRWHGARPAVLWEVAGEAQRLTAPVADPTFETTEASGEALWAAPAERAT